MNELKVATIQTTLHWENPSANLEMFTQKIAAIDQQVDVIVLPETFTTGFSMNTSLAEKPDGNAMQWMQQMAQQYNTAICGSLMMNTKHHDVYNRFIWMNPNGTYHAYNKHHLFSIGKEHNHYKAGNELVIVQYKGFAIRLLVCYDLRFPVWARRTREYDYDAIFIVANWPERRAEHWKVLLQARAIENQSYVIAVNRVGHDGNQIYHSGHSMCIDPLGNTVYYKPEDEDLYTFSINYTELEKARRQFPFLKDSDDFEIV
ncbi:MAG: amidohydrolase [Bacteroidia bacterium]